MKKETGIILASTVGFLTVMGIIGLKKIIKSKHKKYEEYYSDFHRNLQKRYKADEHHGVEFLSML